MFDLSRSRFVFGRSVKFSGTIHVPPSGGADQVAQEVLGSLLVSLTLWSLSHKCFDSTKGLLSFWFVYATDASGSSYPLVVGHWSLWKSCMVHLYTGWWHACTKKMMQQAFRPYLVQNLDTSDYDELVRVTGVDPFTVEKRRKEEGLFCLSADWFRFALESIGSFTFDDIFAECKNHDCKKGDMQQLFSISTYKLVFRNMQSKVSAAAIRGIHPKARSTYDDLSFNFGVPCSRAQLEMLHSVNRYWNGCSLPISHFRSLFETDEHAPVLSYETLRAEFGGGPKDDSKNRPHADRNYRRNEDRNLEHKYRKARGLPEARKGRPRNTPECKEAQNKIQQYRKLNRRVRSKRKHASNDDDDENAAPHVKRPRVKAFIPTKDGRRVPLRHTLLQPAWTTMQPVVAKVLKSAPPPPPPPAPYMMVPVFPSCVPVAPPALRVKALASSSSASACASASPETPAQQFAELLRAQPEVCPSEEEEAEFSGDSSDEASEWESKVSPIRALYTVANQAELRESLMSLK